MSVVDAYCSLFVFTNITLIHLSYGLEKIKNRCVFYSVACIFICRMSLDIFLSANCANYMLLWLASITLAEALLLCYIVRKMAKYTCSPPIILFCIVLVVTILDTFHIYKMLPDKLQSVA